MARKKPISATIDEHLIRWLNDAVLTNKRFRNKSHIIESALESFKKEIEKEKKS